MKKLKLKKVKISQLSNEVLDGVKGGYATESGGGWTTNCNTTETGGGTTTTGGTGSGCNTAGTAFCETNLGCGSDPCGGTGGCATGSCGGGTSTCDPTGNCTGGHNGWYCT